jgi:DNA-directed RNA polymerase specialized sigma subunit
MVNLTESFTKLYGRRPTEAEIATMMQMKREQEGWKNSTQPTPPERPQKRLREPKQPTGVNTNDRQYRWPKRATQIAQRINRMMLRQITIENIAFVEGVSQSRIMQEIRHWDLPKVETDE